MAPLPTASAVPAPEVGARGRLLSNDDGAAAEEPVSPGAPEVSSPGARESRPEEAPSGTAQSDTPEAGAPEAPASQHGAETDDSKLPSIPEVTSSGATQAALVIGNRTQSFARLRPNFEALRKRKGSPSCSSLQLVDEWHRPKVAVDFGRLQRECANAKAEASLATSREASARALEEATKADHRREAAEKRERELRALNASLERQVEARRDALASMKGSPSQEEEVLKREEALMLEAAEHSVELERLETRERQVAQADDAVSAREAGIQEEVGRRVAKARADHDNTHDLKLKMVEAGAEGRTNTLRSRLDEVERREKAAAAALISVQADLAAAHADLLSLQQQVGTATSLVQQSREEACRRQTLQREHAPMLQDLRVRANRALGAICEERVPHPHAEDYASYLRFFTDVVTRLEDCTERARELVEEKSRGLLGRAFPAFSVISRT
nr:tropomyosin-like [Aegilops tauschii subsp. strangulata]